MLKDRFISAKNQLISSSAEHAFKFLIPRGEAITHATEITYADEFFTDYLSAMQTGEYTPAAVANHAGHGQGLSANKVLGDLTTIANRVRYPNNQFEGFEMIIAASILSGHQGPVVEQGVRQTLPFLAKNHIGIIELVRPEDIERYNMKPNLREVFEEIRDFVQEDHGVALFGEGVVQSGRTNKHFKEVFGMRQLKEPAINLVQRSIKAGGKKVLWVPMAFSGDRDILSPDNRFLTRKSAAVVAGIGDPALVKVFVERPIRGDEMPKNIGLIGNLLGSRIAQHLPIVEQGWYRNMRF